jgi:hypothetical protein
LKQKRLIWFALLTLGIALTAVVGRAQQPKYKVGDRVEIDTLMSSDPRSATYKPGKIVAIDDANPADKAYIVVLDSKPSLKMRYIIRDYTKHWIRDIQGGDVEKPNAIKTNDRSTGPNAKAESGKARVDGNNTLLADRELLECKNLKAGPARNGQPPPTELIKNLIRCTFERPASPGQDGARTMDIVGFTADGTRRWNRAEYQGMHATAATIVYIFHVKYNKKTFYRTTTETETGSERNFACYVDGTEWYCGTAAGGVKDGEKKTIAVDR